MNPPAFTMRTTFARVKRFASFSAADQRVLLVSALCLPLIWVALRTMGLGRVQSRLQSARTTAAPRLALDEALALGNLVNMAARHSWFPATCLSRSLLLQWLLRRRGVESRLRIGVRSPAGALEAHAWVECEGVPINDDADVANRW
jgi:hypothetical protein